MERKKPVKAELEAVCRIFSLALQQNLCAKGEFHWHINGKIKTWRLKRTWGIQCEERQRAKHVPWGIPEDQEYVVKPGVEEDGVC